MHLINVPVHTYAVLYSIQQTQVWYLIHVPIHQDISDPSSGMPSAIGVGDGGGGVRCRTSFPPTKIAQVLEEVDQRALSKRHLKGLSYEIDFENVDKKLTDLGLNKGRGWFLNFSEAPLIFG